MPATCTVLSGITKGCANNLGGITELYLWDMLDEGLRTENTSTWIVTGASVGVTGTGGASASIFQYSLLRNTGNFTDEAVIDPATGSSFFKQTINLMFPRREAAKSASIKLLGDGQRDLGGLVKDANGVYWMFKNLQLTAVGDGSGTAKADGSKYSVTLTSETEYTTFTMGTASVSTFLAAGRF